MDSTFSTVLDAVFDQSYLDIDCADGDSVKMCLRHYTDCFPYANNIANTAMLLLGATLGSCDNENKEVSGTETKIENKIYEENKLNSSKLNLSIYPNPITTFTNITFFLPQQQKVSVQIFDMMGRLVKTLANAQMQTGNHQLLWNAGNENVIAGVYLLKLQAGNDVKTIKISVAK
jgi:hypothetical protein